VGFVTRVARAVAYRLAFRLAVGLCVLLVLWSLRAGLAQEALRTWPWLAVPFQAIGGAASTASAVAGEVLGGVLSSIAGAGPAAAGPVSAQVNAPVASQSTAAAVSVEDGDTVKVVTSSMSYFTVRLASIDAPETSHRSGTKAGQPFSDAARRYLSSLVLGKALTLRCYGPDRYERQVCDIRVADTSVNRAMVEAGLAWANVSSGGRYLRDKSLVEVQARAREQRLGLWRDRDPVAPWVWRQQCWQGGVCPSPDPR
jgi:micrococcal nuclease